MVIGISSICKCQLTPTTYAYLILMETEIGNVSMNNRY